MSDTTRITKRFRYKEIIMERTFNVPRQVVWDCWTQPEHVGNWWGPHGYAMAGCSIDLRVGGRWQYTLRKQNGKEFRFSGTYKEITSPEKLVYTDGIDLGNTRRESLTTVTFEDVGGITKLVSHTLFPSRIAMLAAVATGMAQGMVKTMENLDNYLDAL